MKRYLKPYYRFIKTSIMAIGVVMAATLLIINIVNNLKHEYLLITKGIEVSAEIIEVEEEYEDEERGEVNVYYNYAYAFYLPTGVEIISGGKCNDLRNLRNTVEVVYLGKNPKINRIKSSLPSTVKIFFRKVVVLDGIIVLIILLIGGAIFKPVLKESIKEFHEIKKKKLSSKILQKPSWTNRTVKEIIEAKWEDLNYWERISQRHLQANPDMTLEEATEALDILP